MAKMYVCPAPAAANKGVEKEKGEGNKRSKKSRGKFSNGENVCMSPAVVNAGVEKEKGEDNKSLKSQEANSVMAKMSVCLLLRPTRGLKRKRAKSTKV